MLEERISVISGRAPVIFVAPHGATCDDVNTDQVAEMAAESMKGYAVINRGFERSDHVDLKLEKANCNNVEHCLHDVVKEEFLDPLVKFKKRILREYPFVYIFYLHGVANDIRKKVDDPKLGYIIGWGAGKPPSHTCEKWRKDAFISILSSSDNYIAYEGKAGGNFSGWKKNNMNQYFRKWQRDENVHSMQVEMAYDLRSTRDKARTTGQIMGICVEELLRQSSWEPEIFGAFI